VIEYGRNRNVARFERQRTMLQFAKDKRIMGKIQASNAPCSYAWTCTRKDAKDAKKSFKFLA
jgi:hypothetical protein